MGIKKRLVSWLVDEAKSQLGSLILSQTQEYAKLSLRRYGNNWIKNRMEGYRNWEEKKHANSSDEIR